MRFSSSLLLSLTTPEEQEARALSWVTSIISEGAKQVGEGEKRR